jgi:hypothetical protein
VAAPRLVQRKGARRQERFECSSFDELQHERVDAARVLEAVNRGDVRMIEQRKDFGFSTKPREAIRITRHGPRQNLDRDVTLQLRVGRAVDFSHPAGTERAGDLERADSLPDCETHSRIE